MNTRKISYIDPEEDYLDQEVECAFSKTTEERLAEYCRHVVHNYAQLA